ncbi:MAG: HypC/HybG/HupF family hydrogenase formation chaperone [Wenzhouxiangellaceae bacterium]
MCLGVPMQVETTPPDGLAVRCRSTDGLNSRDVMTVLLDRAPSAGDWLLVHIDTAVRIIDAHEARAVADALAALAAARHGQPFEHLLGDLADRTPELPEHLQPPKPERVR